MGSWASACTPRPSDPTCGSAASPSESVWPEYNLHGDVLNQLVEVPGRGPARTSSSCCTTRHADEVVAEGHTGPLWWDGVDETLPDGIDAAIEQIFALVRARRAREHPLRAGRGESA